MTSRLVCALIPAPVAHTDRSGIRRLGGMSPLEHALAAVSSLSSAPVALLGTVSALDPSRTAASVPGVIALPAPTDDLPGMLSLALDWAEGLAVDAILLHDLARPLTPRAVVERTVDAWRATGHTAAPGVAVTDSVKAVEAGGTLRNVDRASLVAVQSPAVVPLRVLRRALATAWPTHSLVHALQSLGEQVVMVEGSHAGEPILDELSQLRAEITLSER